MDSKKRTQSSSSESSPEIKHKKKKKKDKFTSSTECKNISKEEKKRIKKLKKKEKKRLKKSKKTHHRDDDSPIGPSLPPDFNESSKARAPMTRDEWEKQQSVVKRVYDPETQRHRLIKGTGEVLEECVSRERHKAINKLATKGDGEFFQSTLKQKVKPK